MAKIIRFHKSVNLVQATRRIHDLITAAPDPAAALRNLLGYSERSGFKGYRALAGIGLVPRDTRQFACGLPVLLVLGDQQTSDGSVSQ